jgi:catechol 2,3-dioxygenase-like lactoylglutathione lyase family enzyme
MTAALSLVSLLVPDYDAGIAFFTRALGWQLREDRPMAPAPKRWVVVGPPDGGTGVLLARAVGADQQAAIGRQGGGRVWLFLHTQRFDADLAALPLHGATLDGTPRTEPYGRVVVFTDPWGNRWDLIEPATA